MTNSELRDAAAKALGWHEHWRIIDPRCHGQRAYYDERQEFRCTVENFTPDTDANQTALLLAEVERRGKFLRFCDVLFDLIRQSGFARRDLLTDFLFANATPEQKTRAAVEALGEKGGAE